MLNFHFTWQAQWILHLAKSGQNVKVLSQFQTMASVGRLKRSYKDAFCVAGAVQETSSSEMFRRSARCFPRMEWKNRKTHWHEAVSCALNFSVLQEVSQNCFVFWGWQFRILKDVAEFRHFGAVNLTFLVEVSQNCFVLDLSPSALEGGLAEFFPFRQADRQKDKQENMDRQIERQIDRYIDR